MRLSIEMVKNSLEPWALDAEFHVLVVLAFEEKKNKDQDRGSFYRCAVDSRRL